MTADEFVGLDGVTSPERNSASPKIHDVNLATSTVYGAHFESEDGVNRAEESVDSDDHVIYGEQPDLLAELTSKTLYGGLFSIVDLAMVGLVFSVLLLGTIVGKVVEPTYFSNKRNFLNVVFVKNGWLWTTLAFGILIYGVCTGSVRLGAPARSSADRAATTSQKVLERISSSTVVGQLSRYIIHTTWWLLFTQWFLGIPIMDRFFVATGGKCEYSEESANSLTKETISSATCRRSGGVWTGGYDPSGHCFLLVLGTLFLVYETLPYIRHRPYSLSVKITLGTAALWAWMYLMTSMYFHTFWEKLVGAIFGLLTVELVYVAIPYLCRPKHSN